MVVSPHGILHGNSFHAHHFKEEKIMSDQSEVRIRCYQCKEPAVEMTKYQYWLKITNFFEFTWLNGDISNELYSDLSDALMTFKGFVDDQEDECLTCDALYEQQQRAKKKKKKKKK